jgi:hypothetical protein
VTLTIPASVAEIGDAALNANLLLTKLIYNAATASIDTTPLPKTIATLEIGTTVKAIPPVFLGANEALTTVVIPPNVISIGNTDATEGAFIQCQALTSVTLNANLIPSSTGAFKLIAATTPKTISKVVIGEDVTVIRKETFAGAVMTNLDLKNVQIIEDSAFENSIWLANVSIPVSVTTIGNSAFNGCTALTQVRIYSVGCFIGSTTPFPNPAATPTATNTVQGLYASGGAGIFTKDTTGTTGVWQRENF